MMPLMYRRLSVCRLTYSIAFADKHNHINGIENFWNQAKRQLRKFNGIPKHNFVLYLKECEWRFNHSGFKSKKRQLKQWAKRYLNELSRSAPRKLWPNNSFVV